MLKTPSSTARALHTPRTPARLWKGWVEAGTSLLNLSRGCNAKPGRSGKTPSLLPQMGKCSFPYNGKRKTAGNQEPSINMKYARLPLHTRKGEEERSGCPGSSAEAEKPSGLQQGQQEDGLGETGGSFPSQGSDGELVTTLETSL